MLKYPRTFHFDFSPEIHSDDKVANQQDLLKNFIGKEIIITEKYDGENSCLKPKEGVFARSHALPTFNPWSSWLKGLFYEKVHLMNDKYWYFGENMYAIHSIEYTKLDSFFYLFAIYDTERKVWLSFNEVVNEAVRLGIKVVKVRFRGIFKNLKEIKVFMDKEIKKPSVLGGECEGFVARTENEFDNQDFQANVVKYVRNGHVQTDEHWKANWKPAKLNS